MPPGGGVDIATLGLILDGRQMRAESTRVTGSLVAMGKAGTSTTKTMLRLAAALGAFVAFKSVIKSAGDFEGALQQSIAIMGDIDDMMRNRLSEAARQVGIDFNIGATAAAEAFFFLASAGLTAEQSLAALVPVATFAKAGMFDMATATDLATDAQSALGLRTGEAAQDIENLVRVTDVLVKANTIANATVEQFATALTTEAGAALKIFNKDIEEGVAVLAVFADQGVKGQVAGTSLSRILRIMTAAAENNEAAYKDLGIAVFDTTGTVRNFADIIEDLENALGGMSDKTRVATLQQLGFMARVQGVINPLIGASSQLREYEAQLRSAGMITQEVSDKQMLAPMERAGRAIKAFVDEGISGGQAILRVLVPALESLAMNAGLVTDAVLALGLALTALGVIAFATSTKVIAIAVPMIAWITTTVSLIFSINSLSAALALLKIAIGPAGWLLIALGVIAAAFVAWRQSVRGVNEELDANLAADQKLLESVRALNDEGLETLRLQAIRAAHPSGVLTEAQIELERQALIVLKEITLEEKRRETARIAAAAAAAVVGGEPGVITSDATRQAQIELARLTALNEAFGESAAILAKINLEFDLQAVLIENASQAKGEDLVALNAQTVALFEQKAIQIELTAAQGGAERIEALQIQVSNQRRFLRALEDSERAVRVVTIAIAGETAALQLGSDATDEQRRKVSDLAKDLKRLEFATADVTKAQEAWAKVLAGIVKLIGEANDKTDEQIRILRENVRQFEEYGRSALQLANALGVVDDQSARTLESLIQMGAAVARIIGGDFSAIPSLIGGIASLFGGGPSEAQTEFKKLMEEQAKLLKQNSDQLERLRDQLDGRNRTESELISARAALNRQLQPIPGGSAIEASSEAFLQILRDDARAASIASGRHGVFSEQQVRDQQRAIVAANLLEAGSSLEELGRIAKQMGIDIFDSAGNLIPGALEDLDKAIELAIEQIRRLEAAFNDGIEVRRLTVLGMDKEAAALALQIRHEKELADAREAGFSDATIAALEHVQALERAAEARRDEIRAIEALEAFQKSLNSGPLSPLSPISQLEKARKEFEETRRAALAGDADAAARLPEAARAFLEASKAVNASSAAFAADFALVNDTITTLLDLFGVQSTAQEQAWQESRTQGTTMTEILAEERAAVVLLAEGFGALVEGQESQKEAIEDLIRVTQQGGEVIET